MGTKARNFQVDGLMILWDEDQAAITSDEVTQVDAEDQILDLGPFRVDARVIVDLTEIEVASNTERFLIRTQFSTSPTFASDVIGGTLIEVGASEITDHSADTAVGRYEIPFTNEIGGVIRRYMRLFVAAEGDVATGIKGIAFVAHY